MFSRLKNFFKKKKQQKSIYETQIEGRSSRPVYTTTDLMNTQTPTSSGSDFLSGYITASIINDLLEASAKQCDTIERSSPSENSTWDNDYGNKSDSWSSSDSSTNDSWSSSDSSGGSDW